MFVPNGMTYSEMLLIAEGATDTAALLDLAFEAVGRPSCTGGAPMLVELVQCRRLRDVVIVADVDAHGAGQRGAESLAVALASYCPSVRAIAAPNGLKDVREWLRAGATHEDVLAAINAAPPRRLAVGSRKMPLRERKANCG